MKCSTSSRLLLFFSLLATARTAAETAARRHPVATNQFRTSPHRAPPDFSQHLKTADADSSPLVDVYYKDADFVLFEEPMEKGWLLQHTTLLTAVEETLAAITFSTSGVLRSMMSPTTMIRIMIASAGSFAIVWWRRTACGDGRWPMRIERDPINTNEQDNKPVLVVDEIAKVVDTTTAVVDDDGAPGKEQCDSLMAENLQRQEQLQAFEQVAANLQAEAIRLRESAAHWESLAHTQQAEVQAAIEAERANSMQQLRRCRDEMIAIVQQQRDDILTEFSIQVKRIRESHLLE